MSRRVKEGSRTARRAMTKSAGRISCQRKTKHAARKAAKTLVGKRRTIGGTVSAAISATLGTITSPEEYRALTYHNDIDWNDPKFDFIAQAFEDGSGLHDIEISG